MRGENGGHRPCFSSVNGITERNAMEKAFVQLVGAGLVVVELLKQAPQTGDGKPMEHSPHLW